MNERYRLRLDYEFTSSIWLGNGSMYDKKDAPIMDKVQADALYCLAQILIGTPVIERVEDEREI